MGSKQNIDLGISAEKAAAVFLKDKGYKILSTNYRTRLGEIDIVAKEKDTLVFVEVKARRSDRFGLPQEAVTARKQRQISKAALSFLKENNLLDKKARFDVVSLVCGDFQTGPELIKNAFELDGSFTL